MEVSNDPLSEHERWTADIDFRERELGLREQELEISKREAKASRWLNPLVLAILAAAIAAAGNAVVALINGNLQRELEYQKSDQMLVLEAIKAGSNSQDQAAENVQFLVNAGLIHDRALSNSLHEFFRKRERGVGPTLPFPGEVVYGCMDPSAYNYNAKATNQAGTTCLYKAK